MKNCLQYMLVLLIGSAFGCKSVSKYTIDSKPLIKIDTGLLGIWKAKEDTDVSNYILVQNNYDVKHNLEEYKFGTYGIYDNCYYITYFNTHGKNPRYLQFNSFLSEVRKNKFLNVSYEYVPYRNDHFFRNEEVKGYFFVRLINVNASYDAMTIAIIADTTLKYLKNSKEVRTRITNNINKSTFYSDTLHFHKVSSYHLSLRESVNKAN